MSLPSRDAFQNTLDGLDAGIQVRHIAAFDLASCGPADLVSAVLDRPDWRIFSQILVRQGGHAVGILLRDGADSGKTVAQQMKPLSDAMLISADAPVSEFLKVCGRDPFRLVVDRTRVTGIATVSDLQKLPVRLHAFMRICHLEMLMAELIRRLSRGSDELWMRQVKAEMIKKAERHRAKYERQDLNLPLIEYIDFAGFEEDPGFNIHLEAPGFNENVADLREQLLSAGWGELDISVSSNGQATCTLRALKIGQKQITYPKQFPKLSGISAKIGIMPLDRSDMRNHEVISKGSLREIVDAWGGVYVRYKGFRVYPYGEPGNDWLNIDRDRSSRRSALSEALQPFATRLRGVDPQRALLSLLSSKSYCGFRGKAKRIPG